MATHYNVSDFSYLLVELLQEGKIMNFDSTINLPPMPVELQVISSVLLKDKVYITGFTDMVPSEDDTSLQVQVYSLEKAKWSTLPRATIYNASIVVIDGRITLIGGRSVKTKKITDVQATWFEEEGQWKESRMNTRRLETGVCQYDSLLLVTGGVMDAAEEGKTTVVNTVDVYNCSTKTWTTPQALELPVKLRSHHLVVFEEYIYVMGGSFVYPISRKSGEKQFNGKAWRAQWSDVKKAVKQSSKAKTKVKSLWMPIVAPPVLRPTVVVYKGFLLSIGGVLGGEPQKGIYMFVDGKADSHWMKVGELNMGRYRHGVVPGPVESRGITLFVVGGYMQSSPEGEDTVRTSSAQIASASASLAQIESASTCIVCLLITVHVHCGYVFL